MDNKYYRKNAQLRYQLSKELDIYKQKKEDANKNKINPFFSPILSALIAISTAIAGFIASSNNYDYGINAFWLPLIVSAIFILVYALNKFILYPIFFWVNKEIKYIIPNNKEFYKNLSQIEKKKILAKFDFDITGLIHLSYVISTDIIEDDITLNEYNRGEALFYIDRCLRKLQSVFVDYAEYTPDIYEYRIKNNMDLLGAAIISLSKSYKTEQDYLKLYIHNAISLFNNIGNIINDKYAKQLVLQIEEK